MNYLIAGPCAAETHEQVMQTAAALKGYADIFRAGIWKPRTSPDTFQGIGDEGLKWLQEVKATTGMDVATEVSTPEQVHQALAAGIDYLWIGARSSANPILVQHVVDAIATSAQTPKGVWVKNPVNEDAELWAGNIHRLLEHRPRLILLLSGLFIAAAIITLAGVWRIVSACFVPIYRWSWIPRT